MQNHSENKFLHGHKESLTFLKEFLKGFSKKYELFTLKFEKTMTGEWRLTLFFGEK